MTPQERLARLSAAGPYVLRTFLTTCSGYAVRPDDVASSSRLRPLPRARATFFRWLRDEVGWSAAAIGRLWDIDHTSVIRLIQTHEGAPRTAIHKFREKRRRNDAAFRDAEQARTVSDMRYALRKVAADPRVPVALRSQAVEVIS